MLKGAFVTDNYVMCLRLTPSSGLEVELSIMYARVDLMFQRQEEHIFCSLNFKWHDFLQLVF